MPEEGKDREVKEELPEDGKVETELFEFVSVCNC